MNILYIHTHDSGRYFHHYGCTDAPTGHLTEWALGEGLTFRKAYTASPTCSPSRAVLLTGQYPHTNGMVGLAHRGFSLNDYSLHLTGFLKSKGYHTALCGVQHEAKDCFDQTESGKIIGYDENISSEIDMTGFPGDFTARWDKDNAEKAAEWLSKPDRPPFFLSFGLYSTHREFPSACYTDPQRLKPPPYIYDNPENRKDHARFLSSLEVFDGCFQKVITALNDGPYAEDTIVIVTTDHGQPPALCQMQPE